MPRLVPYQPPLPGQPIERDRARHEEKLAEAIREQLPSVVGQTPVLTAPGGRQVVVGVKMLQLPQFRRRRNVRAHPAPGLGTGPGKPGDIVAQVPKTDAGDLAGDADGSTIEILIDMDTLQDLVFDDLKLPRLTPTATGRMEEDAPRWTSRRDRGPAQRLDRTATMRAHLRRQVMSPSGPVPLSSLDLKYRSWRTRERPITQAVVGLIRDISGSMDREKVYLTHSLSWWVVSWLRRQYREVALDFWVHHTQAWRVDEPTFFAHRSGGGTVAAAAYEALLESWEHEFPASAYNRYVLHFTDGDDASPDAAFRALESASANFRLWGLAELRPPEAGGLGMRASRLSTALRALPSPPVRVASMASRDDVYETLHTLLGEGAEERGESARARLD